ncbi:IgGFc-binding protein [Platysternon megacephalum]|uniref:IgGFc-binding protein n=1 Tax=Platysternon megacephalum TaxID=55544 RepID=A0A4D9DN08_9SAUR|nr:IgGFc-binding protein [Platysternon megacephalum]
MASESGAALWSLLLTFAFLLAPGRAEIEQPGSAEVLEGAELNLTCSHPTAKASDSTVWYRQLPDPGPQFAVSGYKETTRSPEPAGALHISAERESSPPALRRVRREDAAVYFCARRDTVGQPAAAPFNKPSGVSRRRGTLQWVPEERVDQGELKERNKIWARQRDQGLIPGEEQRHRDSPVTMVPMLGSALVLVFVSGAPGRAEIQQPRSAEDSEGAELNLTCSHGSVTTETIFWYRQFPNRGPQYIVSGYQGIFNSIDPEGALYIRQDRKSSALSLRRASLADAAVYYCALSDTV